MNELLPCPKCHGEDCKTINVVDNDPRIVLDFWRIRCLGCGLEGGSFDTEERAIKSWNTRTPDPRLKEAIEDMKFSIERLEKALPTVKNKDVYKAMIGTAKGMMDIVERHIPEVKE